MLTLDDCIALGEPTAAEIAATSEHEHIQEIDAPEHGSYPIDTPRGSTAIRRIDLDDTEAARARGDLKHALALRLVLRHFVQTHPDAPARGAAREG